MSFGVSPSDVVKLVEFSTRLYVAFKDANDNSEAQVEGLVHEFSAFHECLKQLNELMKDYGKPLPFPYLDFKNTLDKCDKAIKPYANHLVDNKKMTAKKFAYTIKYIGKEKEIDGLRKQLNGHFQALQMCINFLQLRMHLEATKQTQRLLDSAPFRSISFGGHMYTSNAFASSSRANPNALPAPSEADQLYKDWLVFNRWLKGEDDQLVPDGNLSSRPRSLGSTPAVAPNGDAQTAAVLYHLQRELEAAILIEENRAKRVAVEKRTNLSPNDAIIEEVRAMPQVPTRAFPQMRTFTINTDDARDFTRSPQPSMSEPVATPRPSPMVSATTSPSGSPQIQQSYFNPVDWGHLSPGHHNRHSVSTLNTDVSSSPFSVSTVHSGLGTSPESPSNMLGITTAETTPGTDMLRSRHSVTSLATMALGEGALTWTKLCKKVEVERTTAKGVERRECDLHWRYGEDAGLSIRSVYRSGKEVKVWITQNFLATGPSIPLTTSDPEGETSLDFPRASFGRLEKRCLDVKYTFANSEASLPLQTLLYTNNGKDDAELLYDRPIVTISSDKFKPECRGKNVRLWRRTEDHEGLNGPMSADVLVLLFYTSALDEDKGHWVEEPHYAFQWLDDAVYKKSSEKLVLTFSKEPGKWDRDKLFRRKSSKEGDQIGFGDALVARRTSASSSLRRTDTVTSMASVKSNKSIFGVGKPSRTAGLNRFGYSELEIKFESKQDRAEFLRVWKTYVKPLGGSDEA